MHPIDEYRQFITRRALLGRAATGLGTLGLASLLNPQLFAEPGRNAVGGLDELPHFAPKCKRVIYLFQSGGPSQLDLYDYKPELAKRFGEEVPTSVYPPERKTTMSSGQKSFPTAPSIFKFRPMGKCGTYFSELLPYTGAMADHLCVIRSIHSEAINHDPAMTIWATGSQIPGRPSMGAWISYGLGSENADLPAFVAMSSNGTAKAGQPLYDRLWGSGFLPGKYQGVKFRDGDEPILDIFNPRGVDHTTRRTMLDFTRRLNEIKKQEFGDPAIQTRIDQYELAYRMQMSVPDLVDFSNETRSTLEMYGPDVHKGGTYAFNCLLARRLAERGVRFIQLYHRGWDQHNNLPEQIRKQCENTDQPTCALLRDLARRGLLDDTLVIWGGEFGRTVYSQGGLTAKNYGRDHHPGCFTMWLAGGGVKGGITYGETDDYSVRPVRDPVHVHDLHATVLHLLGIDHTRLTYMYQGRHFRLTDVSGNVVEKILS